MALGLGVDERRWLSEVPTAKRVTLVSEEPHLAASPSDIM